MERERFLASVRANAAIGILPTAPQTTTGPPNLPDVDLVETFCARLGIIGGHAHRCTVEETPSQVLDLLGEYEATALIAWDDLPVSGLRGLLERGRSRNPDLCPSQLIGRTVPITSAATSDLRRD